MNTDLWNKIMQFDLDGPPSEYDFSTRLAHENYWTKAFTQKAILEYKKFMYLAATSDQMVSPSEVVDTVWHQHLIFTQSYQEFCALLGKQVQHVPSTHNREEAQRFRQARERTKRLYQESFGEQPSSIWEYSSMYESLHLPKARLKLRGFVLIGIGAFVALIAPFYYLLRPLYIQIGNPDFLIGYAILAMITLGGLELLNRRRLRQMVDAFDKNSFVFHLDPLEMVYLKTQKLSNVINGVLNALIENWHVTVYTDNTLARSEKDHTGSLEEVQVLETLKGLGRTYYPNLLRQLLLKPVFTNTASCMDAFKKYVSKSRKFGRLFYLNFGLLALLVMVALIRLSTGVERERPVTQIFIALVATIIFSVFFLDRLTRQVCTHTVPQVYKQEILPQRQVQGDWQWQYFILGTAVLATSFAPLVNYVERNEGSGGSGCGTSCGSSCGSSCSSCGGCGGGD